MTSWIFIAVSVFMINAVSGYGVRRPAFIVSYGLYAGCIVWSLYERNLAAMCLLFLGGFTASLRQDIEADRKRGNFCGGDAPSGFGDTI